MRLILFAPLIALVIALDSPEILYTDISIANYTDSLAKIRDVKLKYYTFKHDSLSGRRQLGVIGIDAEKYFPDSLDVVKNYSLPSKDRNSPPTIIQNFPVIDKNVIFMHGVAALKEIITQFNELKMTLQSSLDTWDSQKQIFEEIERKLSLDNVHKNKELELLSFANSSLNRVTITLDELKVENLMRLKENELEERRALLAYQEKLALARMNHEEELARKSMEESIKYERELLEHRELMRRETTEALQKQRVELEKEIDIKRNQLEMDKIKAEIEAKALAERSNEDLILRQLRTQADLDTKRIVQSIQTISAQLSRLLSDFFSQPKQLFFIGSVLAAIALAYYLLKEFISFLRQLIQSKFGKPKLIRETNARGLWQSPWSAAGFSLFTERPESSMLFIQQVFKNVILCGEDRDRVMQLALTTRNSKRAGVPYRHVLLHGPPGTGKTLIARRLAEASGMDYAIMSGGDVGPLGEDAVTQLHGLFQWAARSRRGLLLFIDEAEAFLSSRQGMRSEDAHLRHALNALLYQTGTQSTQFMMVLASNRPQDLDSAILDRVDISLHVGLPIAPQRASLLELYMAVHVAPSAPATPTIFRSLWFWSLSSSKDRGIRVDEKCRQKDTLLKLAERLDGFSGREISKLMIAVRYALLLSASRVLTIDLLESVVKMKLKEHAEKSGFNNK